jgi:CMP-N,N'-diacetyllegionaminic acid synthase
MTGRIGLICARGGSKGVPGKNVQPFHGVPLIAWSIAQLKASGVVDAVAVSSDSAEILKVATDHGCDLAIERPADLATDEAAVAPAILHAVAEAEVARATTFATIVYLQATSPIRLPEDIAEAVALFEATGAQSVVSAVRTEASPYFSLLEEAADGTAHLSKPLPCGVARRQDAPATFRLNGSIYVLDCVRFADMQVLTPTTRIYEMPEDRSIDIDTPFDWDIAEFAMGRALALYPELRSVMP